MSESNDEIWGEAVYDSHFDEHDPFSGWEDAVAALPAAAASSKVVYAIVPAPPADPPIDLTALSPGSEPPPIPDASLLAEPQGMDGEEYVYGDSVIQSAKDAVRRLFGDLFASSPTFRDYANRRIAASRPVIQTPAVFAKARDWQIDFGPASMPAGETTTITMSPQCFFRAEKLMATDTATPAGYGTRVTQVTVGQKIQRPAGGRGANTLTAFFAANSLGNGIVWDTCSPALDLAVTVSFIQAVTFHMTVFGKAVIV